MTEGVTFSGDGVEVSELSDVAGAEFKLSEGQTLTADGEATITANSDNVGINVGEDGKALTVDGSAQINAPAETELTLGNASYSVKWRRIHDRQTPTARTLWDFL